ncbi:hypothetical protein Adt_33270 [Abeliophyllum distichum]|uniref:Uncharacterized protein n=1 Tax=Abeliophyllum distichum TaxID=126358 RepID=A0ABD1QVS7_9LAMI
MNTDDAHMMMMMQQPCKEEFVDWPNGLLAIGTFGNNNMKDVAEDKSNNIIEDTPEEEKEEIEEQQLDDKELKQLFHLPLSSLGEEFFHHFPSREHDTTTNNESINISEEDSGNSILLHRKEKDHIHLSKAKNGIGKKSFYFLLKKAFICKGGFVTTPILRDPLPQTKLDKSILNKILRAILNKKIYPQSCTPKATPKKYLDKPENDTEDEEATDGNKWVKTDSEYIVLEI